MRSEELGMRNVGKRCVSIAVYSIEMMQSDADKNFVLSSKGGVRCVR